MVYIRIVTVPRLIEVDLSVVAVAAVVVYLEREVVWSSVPSSRPLLLLLVGLTADCCCCCASLLSLWWCPAKEEEEDEVVDSSELLFANIFLFLYGDVARPKQQEDCLSIFDHLPPCLMLFFY